MSSEVRVGVLGAGSFGTALAVVLANTGQPVRLWARRDDMVETMRAERRNPTYLSQVELPPSLEITADVADVAGLPVLLSAVPSHGFREVLRELLAHRPADGPLHLVSATKGMETETLARMSQVTAEEAATADRPVRFAVLSGPTFALELAQGVPTTAVIAAEDEDFASELQELLSTRTFRLYTSDDVVGVELGGTAKNVIAIAAGILTGLGLGHNTLAALLTRGLHEITRLGVACGGSMRTFSGLAGMGDLVLTCTGGLSRNRQIGLELAAGRTLADITGGTRQVAEGVRNSLAVSRLAHREEVSMPITEQMMQVVHHGKPARQAVFELMTRALKAEAEL
jgi:glycerol-3-phosphate dehydrogenase (NAD(P)+)